MTHIEKDMNFEEAQVQWYCEQLLERFAEKHLQMQDFRDQWFMREKFDPQLGEVDEEGRQVDTNPFKGMEPFQSPVISVMGHKTIDRLTENRAIVDIQAPRGQTDLEAKATDIASIFNTWKQEMEGRIGTQWGRAMADGQVRLSYGIIHVRRADEVWPDMSRRISKTKKAGYNKVPDGQYKGQYRESPNTYAQRRNFTQAHYGSPWHVTFPNPNNFVPMYDDHPTGGMAMALLSYEVYVLDYERAVNEGDSGSATSLSEIDPKVDIAEELPAPGIDESLGASTQITDTPSSDATGDDERIHVYQLWTRHEFYEATGKGDGAFQIRKAFKHDYEEVPFRLVTARVSQETDPCWRWTPYMWPLYQVAPSYNRFVSLTQAVAELTANPLFLRKQSTNERGPFLPDGVPPDESFGSSLGDEIPQGTEIVQLQVQYSAGLSEGLANWNSLIKEMTPDTGFFEIDARSAPWTARIGQSQSSVGPKTLLEEQDNAISWVFRLILKWHAAHPEEALAAFETMADGSVNRSKVIEVDAEDLELFLPTAATEATSSAERITNTEHLVGLLERQLITPEEFYEEGRGEKDPRDAATKAMVNRVSAPFREQALQQALAARLGSKFVAGLNGEITGQGGQPANPVDVAAANGFTPRAQQQTTPGAGGLQTNNNGFPGGSLPGLSAPGTIPLPGNSGIGAG